MSDSFSGSLGRGKDRYEVRPHADNWGVYDNLNKRFTKTNMSKTSAQAEVDKLKNRHRK